PPGPRETPRPSPSRSVASRCSLAWRWGGEGELSRLAGFAEVSRGRGGLYTGFIAENYYGKSEEEIVIRFCEEEDLDPADALVAIVRAMVERHVDRDLRARGARPPFPGGERPEALVPTMDALHERRSGGT